MNFDEHGFLHIICTISNGVALKYIWTIVIDTWFAAPPSQTLNIELMEKPPLSWERGNDVLKRP